MSTKSTLHISLNFDESFNNYEDIEKLKMLSGHINGFAGYVFSPDIGSVYDIPENYEKIFSALESAGKKFFPIGCKFQELKLNKNYLRMYYYPDDKKILNKFREHMRSMDVLFVDSIEEDLYFSIEIDNVDIEKASSLIDEYIPTKKLISFISASIRKFNNKKTRLYYQTVIY